MACPFFFPNERQETANWLNPPRVPLGDLHEGECRSQTSAVGLTEYCNTGYGRGQCGYFPEDADVDAVRFHLLADHGDRLEVQYTLEKACWPVGHGLLSVSVEEPYTSDILRQQASKFAASYARRRSTTTRGA